MAKPAKPPKLPPEERKRPSGDGRPQEYDRAALTKAICERLSTGEPLAVICRDIGLPLRTLNDWRKADAEISAQFDEARDLGFDAIAYGCMDIADDKLEHPVSRKVRIETRLKLLAKWDPRRYGEKVQLADADGNKLPAHQMSDAELATIIAQAAKGGDRG